MVDIIIRFPLQSSYIDYSDIQLIVINVFGLIVQSVFFTYGFVNSLRGKLSPKRMGIVIAAFFTSMCITGSINIQKDATWQIISLAVVLLLPSIIGAVTSVLFFICGKSSRILPILIDLSAVLGMIRLLLSMVEMICYSREFVSMNTTLGMLLKIAIYGLVVYQTYVLNKKRANAIIIV